MQTQRYQSLDVFRGATVALMILVNNPGSWGHIFSPLAHASWHGLTPTDLVFPFFLFAVGNAMSFVMPKLAKGTDLDFWKKVLKRTILIFAIGLFLNWSPFVKWSDGALVFKQWEQIRILGVLQRIALCYFFASVIIYYGKSTWALYIGAVILLLYWLLTTLLGAPGHPYSLSGYFGNAIDQSILGITHIYKGEGVPFDPEGLTSTLPAIVQVIFGFLVGEYIQNKGGVDGYFIRKHDVGVIAQEIEKVLPEAVATRTNGEKAVKYEMIVPLLIEAIKEQQSEINNLRVQLVQLSEKI